MHVCQNVILCEQHRLQPYSEGGGITPRACATEYSLWQKENLKQHSVAESMSFGFYFHLISLVNVFFLSHYHVKVWD